MAATRTPPAVRILTGDMVLCADGPKVGQVFSLADWQESVAATERISARKPPDAPRSSYLDYHLTGQHVPHPEQVQAAHGVTCRAAVYRAPQPRRTR